jgi:hypothetical protein
MKAAHGSMAASIRSAVASDMVMFLYIKRRLCNKEKQQKIEGNERSVDETATDSTGRRREEEESCSMCAKEGLPRNRPLVQRRPRAGPHVRLELMRCP